MLPGERDDALGQVAFARGDDLRRGRLTGHIPESRCATTAWQRRVVVDPVRAGAPEDLPDLPLQGSILDTRA